MSYPAAVTTTAPPPQTRDTAADRTAPPAGDGDAGDGDAGDGPAAAGDPFTAEEYAQFAAEDGRAGRVIGWLLCFLFVYTILVASAAIWWTLTGG